MMTVIQQQGILSRPISTVNILGGKHRTIKFFRSYPVGGKFAY